MELLTPVVAYREQRVQRESSVAEASVLAEGRWRVGLLYNAKPNGDIILNAAYDYLVAKGYAESSVFRAKGTSGQGAGEEDIAVLATCDVVLTALGNCGSCTAWSIMDCIELERRGTRTVTFVTDRLFPFAERVANGEGVSLDRLPIIVMSHDITQAASPVAKEMTQKLLPEIETTVLASKRRAAGVSEITGYPEEGPPVETVEVETSELETCEYFRREGWIDGLPITPPTEYRVARMVGKWPRRMVLGRVAPGGRLLTVESLAVNAVMAGCEPAYFPVVVAAARVILKSEFYLLSVNTTTNANAPLFIVSGPIAREIGLNGGGDVLGSYYRANITIGRAIRLVMISVGDCRPQDGDMATQGQSAKVGLCITENMDESPWDSLGAELGFGADSNSIAGLGITGQMNMLDFGSRSGADVLKMFAGTIAVPGLQNVQTSGGPVLCIGPTRAKLLAESGFSKSDIKHWLYEHARVPIGNFSAGTVEDILPARRPKWVVGDRRTSTVPVVDDWRDFTVIVAGGVGSHSVLMPTHVVTRPVAESVVFP